MEDVIDDLQPEEISDALGLLELFARIGQITPRELKALGRRVEQRRQSPWRTASERSWRSKSDGQRHATSRRQSPME